MNCDEFQRQFQRWLDRRNSLPDREMQEHTDHCESCRNQLQLWQVIETSIADTSRKTNVAGRSIVAVAVAACLIFALVMIRPGDVSKDPLSLTSIDPQIIDSDSPSLASDLNLDPSGWWNDIRDRDWVSQTMPTVRVVREGVAPLGRSIQRAAMLLATAPREQTS